MGEQVYPRVGGGNVELECRDTLSEGLSPRGRGKRVERFTQGYGPGSIPAWAGETCGFAVPQVLVRVYPRVGGGNPSGYTPDGLQTGLSPRGRGKLSGLSSFPHNLGSIPAWAGETLIFKSAASIAAVYPRVGGGNALSPPSQQSSVGLSPRGRGKRSAHL